MSHYHHHQRRPSILRYLPLTGVNAFDHPVIASCTSTSSVQRSIREMSVYVENDRRYNVSERDEEESVGVGCRNERTSGFIARRAGRWNARRARLSCKVSLFLSLGFLHGFVALSLSLSLFLSLSRARARGTR